MSQHDDSDTLFSEAFEEREHSESDVVLDVRTANHGHTVRCGVGEHVNPAAWKEWETDGLPMTAPLAGAYANKTATQAAGCE